MPTALTEEELKPCPFCGREPITQMRYADGDQMTQPYIGVKCREHTDWITVEQWNRRALSRAEGMVMVPRDVLEHIISALYRKDNFDSHAFAKELEQLIKEKP